MLLRAGIHATTLQPNASTRIDTKRHEERVRTAFGSTRKTRIDTERHQSAREAVDMESNKDLK